MPNPLLRKTASSPNLLKQEQPLDQTQQIGQAQANFNNEFSDLKNEFSNPQQQNAAPELSMPSNNWPTEQNQSNALKSSVAPKQAQAGEAEPLGHVGSQGSDYFKWNIGANAASSVIGGLVNLGTSSIKGAFLKKAQLKEERERSANEYKDLYNKTGYDPGKY